MQPSYIAIQKIIEEYFADKDKGPCLKLLAEHRDTMSRAPGSSVNHQAWEGGYLDHVREGLNLLIVLYPVLANLRPLPFSLASALVVFFVHDLEKPWKYALARQAPPPNKFSTKALRHAFRLKQMAEYGIVLTDQESNAMQYIEGEGDAYSGHHRVMNELAALCHVADTLSARLWHDYPKSVGLDEWVGAFRTGG